MQVGLDPRGQRHLRPAGGVLDPRLHAPGDRLPARDLRRLVPHADAHGRVRRGLGEVARAARTRRCSRSLGTGQRRPRAPSPRATPSSRGTRCGSGAARRSRSTASWRSRRRATRTSASPARPTSRRPSAARTSSSRARTRAVGSSTTRWVAPGTHLAALGADLEGEQELHPAILQRGAGLRRRHPPVHPGRRDQRPAARGPDHRGRRRRRDRQGDLRRARGPPVGRPGHGVRLHRDRAAGLGHGPARGTSAPFAAGVGIEKKMIST